MPLKNTGRLTAVTGPVATPAGATGDDELQYTAIISACQYAGLLVQRINIDTGNTQSLAAGQQAYYMTLPEPGNTLLNAEGFKHAIAIQQATVLTGNTVGNVAVDHDSRFSIHTHTTRQPRSVA